MPELDNLMTMPEIEYNTSEEYWRKQDEIWAEKEDRAWEDIRDNNFKEER